MTNSKFLKDHFPETFSFLNKGASLLVEYFDDVYDSCLGYEKTDSLINTVENKFLLANIYIGEASKLAQKELLFSNAKFWPNCHDIDILISKHLEDFYNKSEVYLNIFNKKKEIYLIQLENLVLDEIVDNSELVDDKLRDKIEDLVYDKLHEELSDLLFVSGLTRIRLYPHGIDESIEDLKSYRKYWKFQIDSFKDHEWHINYKKHLPIS